jgi:hypothetical protein
MKVIKRILFVDKDGDLCKYEMRRDKETRAVQEATYKIPLDTS